MLGASFLPARFRNDHTRGTDPNPSYVNRQVTSLLRSISLRAFNHPIRTICFVALLASTSYVGVLEGSLSDNTSLAVDAVEGTDFDYLVDNGKRLRLGEETAWKWKPDQGRLNGTNAQHRTVVTLVFPDSLSSRSLRNAPSIHKIPFVNHGGTRPLHSTLNPLSPISQDSSLAFSVPFSETSRFLESVQDLPNDAVFHAEHSDTIHSTTTWVAKNNGVASYKSLRGWASSAWTNFVDLLKVCSKRG